MATHDYVLANQSGSSFRTDLNNALAAVVSNNSNATEPSTKYAYELWADTNSGYLKIRNAANNAWVQLFKLDGTLSDIPVEGTVVKSTGESGGTKFLREDGDNSCSWQSISQTALTGSTNNTITTVTGANAIQGEANLTFDGNSLILENTTGNIKNVRNGGGATLNLQGNQDTGNTVPNDGSDVGNIAFSTADGTDRNNTIAYISVVRDGGTFSNSSHPSKIKLMTCPSGSTTISSRFEVMPDGDVKIVDGDLVIGTAGHGIDFSATANGGVGTPSELFDDYETGSWTPVLRYKDTSDVWQACTFTDNLDYANGRYTKVGNTVHGWYYTGYCTIGSAANNRPVQIAGLPFPFKNGEPYYGGTFVFTHCDLFGDGSSNAIEVNTGYANYAQSYFVPMRSSGSNNVNGASWYTSGHYIMVSFTYQTD